MRALAASVLLVGTAIAGETVTVTLYDAVLYRPDGTVQHYKDLAECTAAAPAAVAPGAKSRCHVINYVVKVGACDPAEPPELPTEQEAIAVQCPANDTRWFIRATGWERESYPSCQFKLALLPKEANPPFCATPPMTQSTPMPWEKPEDFLAMLKCGEPPCVDPEYDEFDPVGPGPGPPGATTGDKP